MINSRLPLMFTLAALSFTSLHATGIYSSPATIAAGASAPFQVSEKTQVPGHTLKPGNYSLQVVDRLADRMVLRITSDAGKEETTFLAVSPTAAFPANPAPGPVGMIVKGGHASALRGFVFPDGTRAEFVYLKTEAVPLAKANSTTLVAIDPASEGRADKNNLSPTDRQLVTLWMLTPTVVGNTPAMEAQRYQVAANAKPSAPQYWDAPVARVPVARVPAARVPNDRPSKTLTATNTPPPPPHRVANPIATLPHTAGNQPLVLLAGIFSILTASLLSFRRLAKVRGN